jgi:L-alanine-DL-glutamate epimerase-like enolase superfamily enzyme
MYVESIEAIPIAMDIRPLTERGGIGPYVSSGHEHDTIERTLVRLETTGDVTGWGEIRTPLDSPTTARALIEDTIAPHVVGREVGDVVDLTAALDSTYMSVAPVLGGVDMAMWDAHARRLGVPLHELFGVRDPDPVDVAFCLGITDRETAREKAAEAADMGFEIVKTKAGRDWREDVDRITAMADEVGDEIDFRVDPNGAWRVDEAVRAARQFEDAGVPIQYLEQPVEPSQFGTYARLRSRHRLPLAVNEDTYLQGNTLEAIKHDAVDVALIDIVPAGGFREARRLAHVFECAGVSLTHHTGFDLGVKTAASLHFIASTRAVTLPPDSAYYAWDDDVIETPFEVDDGHLDVPTGAGLGVTIDETKLDAYRIDW